MASSRSSHTGRRHLTDANLYEERAQGPHWILTLSGHVLPVAGVKERVAGACRRGLVRVVLPRHNEEHFERGVGDDVWRRLTVHYVHRVDDLPDLVLLPAEAEGERAPESPRVRL